LIDFKGRKVHKKERTSEFCFALFAFFVADFF